MNMSRNWPTTADIHDCSEYDSDDDGFVTHESKAASVNLNITACITAFCCSCINSCSNDDDDDADDGNEDE